jgi:hypothetical protein
VNLTASAAGLAPDKPPAAWFADPKLAGPTALTVTSDGRVYGHLALWGSCHIGYPDCVTPPHSASGYRFFHLGEVETAKGERIDCGQITLETAHAGMASDWQRAKEHYAHTGCASADVRAGEDAFGIWIAGAVRPELSTIDLRKLRGAKISGDWRHIEGRLELIGALGVNIPGYPVPRTVARVASGEPFALVAAGIVQDMTECQRAEIVELLEEIGH